MFLAAVVVISSLSLDSVDAAGQGADVGGQGVHFVASATVGQLFVVVLTVVVVVSGGGLTYSSS